MCRKFIFFVFPTVNSLVFFQKNYQTSNVSILLCIFIFLCKIVYMSLLKKVNMSKLGVILLLVIPTLLIAQSRKPKPQRFSAVKLSVAPIFVGEIAGIYERSFTKKTSFEVGLGLVTDNYIKNALEEVLVVNARKVVPGPSASIGLRYYPMILGENIYFSTEYKYRLYRKNFSQDGGTIITKEYFQRMMPRVGIGYHFYFDKRFFLDLSGNLGFSLDKKSQVGDAYPIKKYLEIKFKS